ncbi:DNA internalization-related competence protein ComEC/Rec2 [Stutzerimonas tarimensis]|uniref:DNA internalization-related competence protein ComEC/Rec2 n=1 Tax=Stutzerimonas tarimensis TaxID=1507735 RepID=A0ABV7T7C9_9GAMM
MLKKLFALAAGLALLRFLPALPPLPILLPLVGLAVGLGLMQREALALFCLGLSWGCVTAGQVLEQQLPRELDGRTFWLEGRVVGLPAQGSGVVRFELEDIRSRHAGIPPRLRLGWYDGPPLQAGERWRVAATLKRPHGLINPQSFDYEAWLLARRIGATGTVKAGERLESGSGAGLWRDRLRTRLAGLEAHGRAGAVTALVVGDGSGLSSRDWDILRDTGTVHLLVISGTHISILAGLLYFLVQGLARRGLWPRGLPWLPCACALALSGALGYGWLAGFEVPVQRACAMLAVVLLWRLRFRHLGVGLPILLALNLVLLVEPLASLQPGFWLSFGAVAVLTLVFSGRLGAWSWWHSLTRAQWTTTLGLLPLMVALGLPVAFSGPLANLLAVPWVGFAIVPLVLLGTLLLAVPLVGEAVLWLCGLQLHGLFLVLGWLAEQQPPWSPGGFSTGALLLAGAGILVLLLPAGLPMRPLGLAMLLPLCLPAPDTPDDGTARIWIFDVGQGLSVMVQTARHALLYDAGPRFGDFDTGERVVVPSLQALGIKRLDLMLLSHADLDHAGGAPAIMRAFGPLRTVSGEPERLPVALQAETCEAGESWAWDGVRLTLWRASAPVSSNQTSCVLIVEAGGERLLLTGDIDRQIEAELIASGVTLGARWLLLPHHGSRSSSSAAFLDGVGAAFGLVSRGRHNNFGHPHPDVLARARDAGMHLHDTALEGAIYLELGRFGKATGLRQTRRFWRDFENGSGQ